MPNLANKSNCKTVFFRRFNPFGTCLLRSHLYEDGSFFDPGRRCDDRIELVFIFIVEAIVSTTWLTLLGDISGRPANSTGTGFCSYFAIHGFCFLDV